MDEKNIRVLLVDDHAIVTEGLAQLAEKWDGILIVGQCAKGGMAVQMAAQTRADVVVLDLMMPGNHGLDVCRDLRALKPPPAVVILSMYDSESYITKALHHGALGYVLKGSPAKHLQLAIESVARGEIHLGPGICEKVLQRVHTAAQDPYETLTSRERQVLTLLAQGMNNRQIAEELKVSIKTVDAHRGNVRKKLRFRTHADLVKFAVKRGLVVAE